MIASDLRLDGPAKAAQALDVAQSAAAVGELQHWRLAREKAARHNRNLLQYGAGLAAVLGISAGGGGMIAVANSLGQANTGPLNAIMGSILLASILVGLVLLVLLLGTFRSRQAAERESDEYLGKLIELVPSWFQPKE